jgi:UDP:flavonoid glycosyltransferase YjiC (YdhE family)
MGRLFIDGLARRTAADSAELLPKLRPDLIVYEHLEFGAAVAAHAVAVPAICHSLSPRMPAEAIRLVSGDRLDRLWVDHGVSAPSLDVFTGDAYIDIFPNVLQDPRFRADPSRLPLRPIPYTETGVTVPPWVGRTSHRLVYLTLGTVVATDDVLLPALRGLTLDVDVLVALGSASGAELGELPSNVHIEAFVDQTAVLHHADLGVHHGGSGTILGALAAGTPQLLLPKGADQFLNADAMRPTGLASVLEPSEATAVSVAAEAAAAIGQLRPAADAVREELDAMPDPAEVVELLVSSFRNGSAGATAAA